MNKILFRLALACVALVTPAFADMYPDASNAKLPDARLNLAAAPHVATKALLAAASTAVYPSGVWRDDYSGGLGAPPLFFKPSGSACSISGGDGGSQVPSADGKCWLAAFPSLRDPRQWGAAGDCTADDTAPLEAAIKASTNQTVIIAQCYRITAGLTITAPVELVGNNARPHASWPSNGMSAACTAGIKVDTANLAAAIAVAGGASGMEIRNVCIDNRNITNTSGATITAVATSGTVLNNTRLIGNEIIGCFICVDISGTGASTQNVGGILERNVFFPNDMAGSIAVRVGHFDSGGNNNANTTELKLNNNSVYCNGTISLNSTGYRLEDTGGIHLVNSNSVACNYGLVILPAANQTVSGVFVSNSSFDSDNTSDLYIDTGASSATILELQFTGDWFSAAKGQTVLIQNTGGGILGGIHFSASRFYPRQNTHAVLIRSIGASTGIGNISIRDSMICYEGATSTTGTGINVASTVTTGGELDIVANTIGACDTNGVSGSLLTGVTLAAPAIAASVVANRFQQATTPINLAGTTNLFISNNAGIDDQAAITLAATAPATTIPVNSPTVVLTGVAAVQSFLPAWNGRQIRTINAGNWTTAAGGNINTGYPGPAGKSLTTCVFNSPSWQCQ